MTKQCLVPSVFSWWFAILESGWSSAPFNPDHIILFIWCHRSKKLYNWALCFSTSPLLLTICNFLVWPAGAPFSLVHNCTIFLSWTCFHNNQNPKTNLFRGIRYEALTIKPRGHWHPIVAHLYFLPNLSIIYIYVSPLRQSLKFNMT